MLKKGQIFTQKLRKSTHPWWILSGCC